MSYCALTQDKNSIPHRARAESDRMTLSEKEGSLYMSPLRVSGFLKKPKPFRRVICCFQQIARGHCEPQNDALWALGLPDGQSGRSAQAGGRSPLASPAPRHRDGSTVRVQQQFPRSSRPPLLPSRPCLPEQGIPELSAAHRARH